MRQPIKTDFYAKIFLAVACLGAFVYVGRMWLIYKHPSTTVSQSGETVVRKNVVRTETETKPDGTKRVIEERDLSTTDSHLVSMSLSAPVFPQYSLWELSVSKGITSEWGIGLSHSFILGTQLGIEVPISTLDDLLLKTRLKIGIRF